MVYELKGGGQGQGGGGPSHCFLIDDLFVKLLETCPKCETKIFLDNLCRQIRKKYATGDCQKHVQVEPNDDVVEVL